MRLIITYSEQYRNNGRCEMTTLPLPPVSLRPARRLPVIWVLVRTFNRLIYMTFWSIIETIFGVESNFLPALREASARQRRSVDREVPRDDAVLEDAAAAVRKVTLPGEAVECAVKSQPQDDHRAALGALLPRELAFDAVRGEALAGRGEALGGADVVPLAIVHDRAQAARCFGAVEESDQ